LSAELELIRREPSGVVHSEIWDRLPGLGPERFHRVIVRRLFL
jgi:hypothetical protein